MSGISCAAARPNIAVGTAEATIQKKKIRGTARMTRYYVFAITLCLQLRPLSKKEPLEFGCLPFRQANTSRHTTRISVGMIVSHSEGGTPTPTQAIQIGLFRQGTVAHQSSGSFVGV